MICGYFLTKASKYDRWLSAVSCAWLVQKNVNARYKDIIELLR